MQRKRRQKPIDDAKEFIKRNVDKPGLLKQYINTEKGETILFCSFPATLVTGQMYVLHAFFGRPLGEAYRAGICCGVSVVCASATRAYCDETREPIEFIFCKYLPLDKIISGFVWTAESCCRPLCYAVISRTSLQCLKLHLYVIPSWKTKSALSILKIAIREINFLF